MSIARFREVQYADDGCSIYQCLNCYEDWESRTTPQSWTFCPCCGIRWEGREIARRKGTEKWRWRLLEYTRDADYTGPVDMPRYWRLDEQVERWDARMAANRTVWVIEHRTKLRNRGWHPYEAAVPGHWLVDDAIPMAKKMHKRLQKLRTFEDEKYALAREDFVKFYTHSMCSRAEFRELARGWRRRHIKSEYRVRLMSQADYYKVSGSGSINYV